MQKLLKTLMITLLTAASASLSAAPVGYSINSDSSTSEPDSLYTIDLSTGNVIKNIGIVNLAPLPSGRRMDVEGLAFAPDGTLYGIDDESLSLFRINPANALVDPNRDYKITGTVLTPRDNDFGMTFACDGTLYVTSVTEQSLYKIALTGANTATPTLIGIAGSLGTKIGALAATGSNPTKLYGLSNGAFGNNPLPRLYSINPENGQVLDLGPLNGNYDKNYAEAGLGFDAAGQLWAITDRSPSLPSQVLKIDIGTRTAVEFNMTEQGFESLAIAAPGGCEFGNPGENATFVVQKQFEDGNNITPVTFNFQCTGGTVFNSSKTIFPDKLGFGPYVVEFSVGDLAGGPVECKIWEEPLAGYTPEYDCQSDASCLAKNGAEGACTYPVVSSGQASLCKVNNRVNPVKITVTKEWDVTRMGGANYGRDATVIVSCNAPIVDGYSGPSGTWNKATTLSDPGSYIKNIDGRDTDVGYATVMAFVIPQWYPVAVPPEKQQVTGCWATETNIDSAVESESDCGDADMPGMTVPVGSPGDTSCKITNTVFFEGIPTLNPLGLVLISALMLLTGLVSVRRIV